MNYFKIILSNNNNNNLSCFKIFFAYSDKLPFELHDFTNNVQYYKYLIRNGC